MWKWLTVTVKPWLWRPYYRAYTDWEWVLLPIVFPYIDWAPGFHFNEFGLWFRFGPWNLELGIRDNN